MPNYFNEPEVKQWCVAYQQAPEEERNQIYKDHLAKPIDLLIKGVINTHKLYKWDGWDEAYSIGLETALNSLQNFDATKGFKLFSYLSISVKRSIMFSTLRNKDARNNASLEVQNFETPENDDIFQEDLVHSFLSYAEYYIPIYFSFRHKYMISRYITFIQEMKKIHIKDLKYMKKRFLISYMKQKTNIQPKTAVASTYRQLQQYFAYITPYYQRNERPVFKTTRENVYFLPEKNLVFSQPWDVKAYLQPEKKVKPGIDSLYLKPFEETRLNGVLVRRLK